MQRTACSPRGASARKPSLLSERKQVADTMFQKEQQVGDVCPYSIDRPRCLRVRGQRLCRAPMLFADRAIGFGRAVTFILKPHRTNQSAGGLTLQAASKC
jgi:hypothetical protein